MPTPYAKMTPEQKERARETKRRWYQQNKERARARQRELYHKHRDHKYENQGRSRGYRHRYGITVEDYNRMFAEQGGRCGICGSDKSGRNGYHFAVDHCHNTGQVRGLLCIRCNASLGWFEQHSTMVAQYLYEASDDD